MVLHSAASGFTSFGDCTHVMSKFDLLSKNGYENNFEMFFLIFQS